MNPTATTLARSTGFEATFGRPPESAGSAPGRVNLLGEHTDYNGGFVLPTVIPQTTRVELARSRDDRCRFYSATLDQLVSFRAGEPAPAGFARYVFGCIQVAREMRELAPLDIWIDSNVPVGAGLSSSAALLVAVLRGVRALFDLQVDDVGIALLAQRAEVEFARVRVGIMDQMAASLGTPGHMLFLDTRSLERKLLPLPPGAQVIAIHSGVPRKLAGSEYNRRREECEQAARMLGVAMLRDADDLAAAEQLPEPLNRRARHVIGENRRVIAASRGVSASEFGALMNASHASLRDDYEVSISALDELVGLLQAHPRVFGAKLTGAGFGGACVALAAAGSAAEVNSDILKAYRGKGYDGTALV